MRLSLGDSSALAYPTIHRFITASFYHTGTPSCLIPSFRNPIIQSFRYSVSVSVRQTSVSTLLNPSFILALFYKKYRLSVITSVLISSFHHSFSPHFFTTSFHQSFMSSPHHSVSHSFPIPSFRQSLISSFRQSIRPLPPVGAWRRPVCQAFGHV